ncbi:MAG TPA: MFS transporter [Roseiflexaceae bacterium]|nr:MFS transporter [Roseiflexaceae bacterium]
MAPSSEAGTSTPLERPRPRLSARQTFAALRHRNYRLWFFGQMVSLFGTWMQATAQGYLVYQLTGSPAYLGVVGFAAGVPAWVFTLYGGVVADRVPRRTLLLITQVTMMGLAFVLAGLVFAGAVQAWHIAALAFALGVANAFDAPARLAFVRELVDREDMTNAIALNATMFNIATFSGPAVAGLTYALIGPAWCFALNGLSFLGVIWALLLMRLPPQARPARRGSAWEELGEGLRYILRTPAVRTLILLAGATSLFGISFATLFPVWATDILGGDATTNGLLQSARGLGALLSALLIASLGRFNYKGRLLTLGSFLFPALLIVFALVRWLPLALLVLVATGVAVILIMNLANALVQNLVPDALRGRVMAVYSLTFFGSMPLGALWAGTLAEVAGAPAAMISGALMGLLVAGLIWVLAPQIRALE